MLPSTWCVICLYLNIGVVQNRSVDVLEVYISSSIVYGESLRILTNSIVVIVILMVIIG